MRIQLPVQLSVRKMLLFASVLFCVQQVEHTKLIFSVLFFGFLMCGVVAFNAGGGFSKASGAYVFLFVALTAGIGVTWKAVVGEPADSNLLVPVLDMAIYAASVFMLLLVILANKMLTGRSTGIAKGELDYTLSALGCLVLGATQTVLNSVGGVGGPGSLLSVVNQLSQFFPLAIILGTIGAIKDSDGRRSVNFISGLAMTMILIGSMLAFTKQGMLTPVACWIVAASFMRFQLRVIHWIVLGIFGVFAFTIVPLLGEGRTSVPGDAGMEVRAAIVYRILTHLDEARSLEKETQNNIVISMGKSGYYNQPQGFMERLSILATDDLFFNYTNQGNYAGYAPVIAYYENFIPHFLDPDKPVPGGGNFYAHEIGGILADADNVTGISFSPMAEAYHVAGWTGILLLLPAIWLSLFITVDFLCGDLRRSPWGLLMVVLFAHAAAESLLGSLIWISGYGNLGLLLAIVFCTQFTPIVGALFFGGNRLSERASAPMKFPRMPGGATTGLSLPWQFTRPWNKPRRSSANYPSRRTR